MLRLWKLDQGREWNLAFRGQRAYLSDVNLLRTGLALALWFGLAARADITVTFQNNVFTPSRLVTFDALTGNLAGSGVRNGVFDGASYVAQLFRVVDGTEIPIGAPANFRAATTTQPGTWSGASRTIVGVNPGETVMLKVKVWDKSVATYELALAAFGLLKGQSAVFAYSQPVVVTVPSDTYMWNFQGFALTDCFDTPEWAFTTPRGAEVPEFTENKLGAIPGGIVGWPPLDMVVPREDWYAMLRQLVPPLAATWGGALVETNGLLFYRHAPNSYGHVGFSFSRDYCGRPWPFTYLGFTVLPSPRRPYLAVENDTPPDSRKLVLRGLAPTRYRVEQSENLTTWEPVGEFTANYGEVPVQDLSPLSATARFYRAVELAP